MASILGLPRLLAALAGLEPTSLLGLIAAQAAVLVAFPIPTLAFAAPFLN